MSSKSREIEAKIAERRGDKSKEWRASGDDSSIASKRSEGDWQQLEEKLREKLVVKIAQCRHLRRENDALCQQLNEALARKTRDRATSETKC